MSSFLQIRLSSFPQNKSLPLYLIVYLESEETGVTKFMIYMKVYELYEMGFSKSAISKRLGISRNTVAKYLKNTSEEFEEYLLTLQTRKKKLDPYRDIILGWLKNFPDLSSAQVYDWLKEKQDVSEENIAENTTRNYVNELRVTHHLPKVSVQRVYAAVPDSPMGFQVQVDFGQDLVNTYNGTRKRLYFIGFVLSHSRYKYIEFLDRPFRTTDLVRCHENAFEFFGGMPEELVYDQDALLAVSENAGDLIFTKEFDNYRKLRRFNIYLCRKSDPESKGKIEQVVKFVKHNFMKNREFHDIHLWNQQTIMWLERTGNYKVHHNTKKRPSEVHSVEKLHLRKVSSKFSFENSLTESITRTIQKDNIIRFESNRYSVPVGTYDAKTKNVAYLEMTTNGFLNIRLQLSGPLIARHLISSSKGQLIYDPSHHKKPSSKKTLLREEIELSFSNSDLISWFLDELNKKYPRHLVDQFKVLQMVIRNHPDYIQEALETVKTLNMISANDFRDIAFTLHKESEAQIQESVESSKYQQFKAAERSEDYYIRLLAGGKSS